MCFLTSYAQAGDRLCIRDRQGGCKLHVGVAELREFNLLFSEVVGIEIGVEDCVWWLGRHQYRMAVDLELGNRHSQVCIWEFEVIDGTTLAGWMIGTTT